MPKLCVHLCHKQWLPNEMTLLQKGLCVSKVRILLSGGSTAK